MLYSGRERSVNEVIWHYQSGRKKTTSCPFERDHDVIFFYSCLGSTRDSTVQPLPWEASGNLKRAEATRSISGSTRCVRLVFSDAEMAKADLDEEWRTGSGR